MRVGDKIEIVRTEEGYELVYRWKVTHKEVVFNDLRRDLCIADVVPEEEVDVAKHGTKHPKPKK